MDIIESEVSVGVALGVIANILSAIVIAGIAYLYRRRIRSFFRGSTLRPISETPTLELEIENTKDVSDNLYTHFLVENVGQVQVSKLRVYLCSNNFDSKILTIKPIEILDQQKWYNDGGHRMQINTKSLHDGCSLMEDQRYFVEFIDDGDGTIYRMSRGSPHPKDGSMAFYGTTICKKRLPKNGLTAEGDNEIDYVTKKYDIDLTVG